MEEISIPQLSAEEQRVLGALIEKSRATPEYYPMTMNGIVLACNQKSARNPVVNYDQETVMVTLNALRKMGLVATVTGAGSRAVKYKHHLAVAFPLVPAELSVICLLLLRGPLTPGEINNMSARLYAFEDLEEVQLLLDKLEQSNPPWVEKMPKKAGQKEQRFIHLLGESVANLPEVIEELSHGSENLENRVQQLEEEVLFLRTHLLKLMGELGMES